MNDPQRGRSPSAGTSGNHTHSILRHTPSPHHPQGPFQAPQSTQGLLGQDTTGANTSFASTNSFGTFDGSQGAFNTAFNSTQNYNNQPTFTQPGYLDSSLPEGLTNSADYSGNTSNIFGNLGNSGFEDPQLFGDLTNNTQYQSDGGALDPALITSQPNTNPGNLMNTMSTQSQTSPTPPHLLSPANMARPGSGSPHNSPGMQQSAFAAPPNHSRHTSLDPSSAAYPQNHNQWNGMTFQHRRAPSDAHSDVSSSAHPSPYLGNTLDYQGSPLLNAQDGDPSMYQEVMGIGQFSLNEPQMGVGAQNPYISPHHSPQPSPRLVPQQQMPTFSTADSYGMMAPQMGSYNNGNVGNAGMEMFPGQGQEAFPALNVNPGDAMSPPVITFEPAPPSRQASFDPIKDENNDGAQGALSPPESSRSRNRMRAKSDSSLGPQRSHSASSPNSRHSGGGADSKDMLSPAAAGVGSRSPSPSGKTSRRSSTSSVPNRDYLLGLADPSRSPSEEGTSLGTGGSKRTQKHPATFQCSLCPKRFTRAYNLRSHLRTHTDERPFVCSVCGKAFARQHDRKRHESLHSGEKKFVCRGNLKEGGTWGCGRRFARADALGRHFRSEAGRVCIKPLLEEEALERQAREGVSGSGMLPGQQQGGLMGAPMGFDAYGGMGAAGQAFDPNLGGPVPMPFRLPTVILQQYPSLGQMDWSTMPAGDPGYDDEISGRSSFDASAGEEDYEDYGQQGGNSGWASDVGAYGTGN